MGRAKLHLNRVELADFSKGYFPNKDLDEVPDGGSSDCKHVIWYRSALRKMFGMDLINASQVAQTRGNGIHFLDVSGVAKRAAVFGSKFYEDVSGTWTDRTGAVTITDGASNHTQFINHQLNANKYLIGVNGVDAPFKWTGAGNAAVLGGSPPIFESVAKYHQAIFGSVNELVYFSDVGDPETYNTGSHVINFDKNVKRLIDNGPKLAVLMEDHIGSIQGFSYLDYAKEEVEIKNVGCMGRLAATKAVFGKDNDVIATISREGVWIIDQAFGQEKILGDDYFQEFNQANLSKAVAAYSSIDHLLYIAAPYGASTENDYLIVVDMMTGAFWPMPSIHTNSIRAMCSARDANGDEYIYFIDSNGYSFKFNKGTVNYHTGAATQGIDARFKTKKYDLKDIHSIRQFAMLAEAVGDWDVTVAIGFGLTSSDGDTGTINLQAEGDLLGSSFVLGASVLAGSDYVFNILSDVGGFGRYLTITLSNDNVDESFNVKKMELQLRRRRMGANDK